MALAERIDVRDQSLSDDGGVVLGDDFVAPENVVEDEVRIRREKRGYLSRGGASLTRKIVTFNLIALNILAAGILFLNASGNGLTQQRADHLASEIELVANVFEAQLPSGAPVNLMTGDGVDVGETLAGIDFRPGVEVFVFDTEGRLTGRIENPAAAGDAETPGYRTYITDAITWAWDLV
ncbi:MAG: sensor N-terminal transmembrane domain-containing protein, partial [Roseovarius sp.]|nr:sensor N-terminal transmembrane domain-containing protein [Roseovarius sp.]